MKTGLYLIGVKVKVLFEPIKMKKYYGNATVIKFNRNLKRKKYTVKTEKGQEYKIKHSQIKMILP
jgi:hypothetical protein